MEIKYVLSHPVGTSTTFSGAETLRIQHVKVEGKRRSIQSCCALSKDSHTCNPTNINVKQLLAVIFLGFVICMLIERYSETLEQLFIKITLKQIKDKPNLFSQEEKLDLTVPLA